MSADEDASASWLGLSSEATSNANFIVLSLWTSRIPGNCQRSAAYVLDIKKDEFYKLIERASKHRGYTARQTSVMRYHQGSTVLEKASTGQMRVIQRKLLSWAELPGAPLLVTRYAHEDQPFSFYSCGGQCDAVTHSTRLALRVHRCAELVFEVTHDERTGASRTVAMEIDLSFGVDADMLRTVQNTVHIVLLGAHPHAQLQQRHPTHGHGSCEKGKADKSARQARRQL
jgi:hypothetical protein